VDEPNWLRSQLDRQLESLQEFAHQRRLFRESTAEVRGQWDDSVSRDVFQRFLIPLSEESAGFERRCDELRPEYERLHVDVAEFYKTQMLARRWAEAAAAAGELADEEIKLCDRSVDSALNFQAAAVGRLRQCLELMQSAGRP
jgi:hypothetical protein